jgi:hypothetical protein
MEYTTKSSVYSNQTFLILSKTGKYGAMNKELQTIVPFEYQSLYQNPDKAQLVGMKENKYGYLDLKGNVLAPCEYDTKIEWRNKWYEITQKNKKYGVVDTNYHTILPFEYDYLQFINDTLLTYQQNQLYGLMHLNGTQILAPMYESIGMWKNNFRVMKKGIYAVIDQTGKEIIPFSKSYNYMEPLNYLLSNVIKVGKKGVDNPMLYGYINDKGKELVPIKYHELSAYDKTMVVTLNGKIGIINDKNKVIVPLMYDNMQYWFTTNNDYCLVYLNKKCGIMNSKYQLITPIAYDTIFTNVNTYKIFSYKRAIVVKNGKKGIIDEKGNEIVPPILAYKYIMPRPDGKFDTNIGGKYRCQCTSCSLIGGQWGLLDTDGSLLIAAKYRYAIKPIGNIFQVTPIDTTHLLENDTYGWGGSSSNPAIDTIQLLIDKNETVLGTYNRIYPFRGNSAMVAKNGKLGVVDGNGRLIVPLVLDDMKDAIEYDTQNQHYNLHIVSQNGKWGVLDSNAQWLIEPQYADIALSDWNINPQTPILYYNVGKLLDQCEKQQAENGKWGAINLRTKAVIPAIYDIITDFSENSFKIYIGETATEEEKGTWGIVDSLGNELVPPIYKSIDQPYWGFIRFQNSDGLFGLMNRTGKQIIPPKYKWITQSTMGYVALYQSDSVIVINNKGTTVFQFLQTSATKFSSISDQWIRINANDTIIFHNLKTKKQFTIPPKTYQNVGNFTELSMFCKVFKNGKQGLINRKGKQIIPPIYDEIKIDQPQKCIYATKNATQTTYDFKGKQLKTQ